MYKHFSKKGGEIMYRIDENTYIDDSLVTCAEYQLFLDEMREQGKFCQPDHWKSCEYLVGQAHMPVLGVRPSDAMVFCNWVSQREKGVWSFRLPTVDEAAQYPIQKHNEQLSGFWTFDKNAYSFAWVGSLPAANPFGIEFFRLFDIALTLDIARSLEHALARINFLNIEYTLEITRALIRTLTSASDLDRGRALYFERALELTLNRAIDRVPHLFLALDHARELARILNLVRASNTNLNNAFKMVVSIWMNLILLQERRTGRSMAFEGIRLVKERKPD